MSKRARLVLAVLVGLLVLLAGVLDVGDPTPPVVRWPIGLVASAGVAVVVWWASGRSNGEEAQSDDNNG